MDGQDYITNNISQDIIPAGSLEKLPFRLFLRNSIRLVRYILLDVWIVSMKSLDQNYRRFSGSKWYVYQKCCSYTVWTKYIFEMDAKLICCNVIYIQNILEKLRCQPLGQRSSCTLDEGKVPGDMFP